MLTDCQSLLGQGDSQDCTAVPLTLNAEMANFPQRVESGVLGDVVGGEGDVLRKIKNPLSGLIGFAGSLWLCDFIINKIYQWEKPGWWQQ